MKGVHWLIGGSIGVIAGLTVAAIFTLHDWRLNPGGIFHDASTTNWSIVFDTAISWFIPVAIAVAALAWLVLYLLSRRS